MAGLFSKLFKQGNDEEKADNQQGTVGEETEKQISDEEIEELLLEEYEEEEEIEPETEKVPGDEDTPSVEAELEAEDGDEENTSFFSKLKDGLFKTRRNITDKINDVLSNFRSVDEELFEELEEILITSDVGVATTMKILTNVRKRVKEENIKEPAGVKELLKQEILEIIGDNGEKVGQDCPQIILVIGVNGVGKTTSIGKIASRLKKSGKKVIIAAADTFRAAAIDQLEIWSNRVGVEVVKHQEGSDPAAVIFDAINSAKSKKADVLICDTAGRLHNKKNLMEELKKISRVIEREFPEAHRETLLVLDATTGQNAISQAKLFKEVADISGLVLTKLDGTAKGGIVIAVKSELDIPVKLIGVGEKVNDLQDFVAEEFVNALFSE